MNKSDPSQNSGNNSFYLNPENVPYSVSKEPSVVVIEKEETFYNLCTVEASCGGRVKYGRFKDRNHALVCTLFGCMTFFLLLAIIAPLVRVVVKIS